MATYLLKTVTSGKVAMEYRVVSGKRDMRNNFCKEHEKDLVNNVAALFILISKHGMRIKGDRIIAPNGKAAYEFSKDLKELRE